VNRGGWQNAAILKGGRADLAEAAGTVARGAGGFFHEAGVANTGSVFQGEVHPAGRIDVSAALAAGVLVGLFHGTILSWEGGERQPGTKKNRWG
jgi:hypothetical protein